MLIQGKLVSGESALTEDMPDVVVIGENSPPNTLSAQHI